MPNFSSLAGLEVAEKFVWGVGGGVVCTVILWSNPTVVLRLGWGFDNIDNSINIEHLPPHDKNLLAIGTCLFIFRTLKNTKSWTIKLPAE